MALTPITLLSRSPPTAVRNAERVSLGSLPTGISGRKGAPRRIPGRTSPPLCLLLFLSPSPGLTTVVMAQLGTQLAHRCPGHRCHTNRWGPWTRWVGLRRRGLVNVHRGLVSRQTPNKTECRKESILTRLSPSRGPGPRPATGVRASTSSCSTSREVNLLFSYSCLLLLLNYSGAAL